MASFTLNSLPVATLLAPNDAAGRLAKMVYTAGSGWASPRMQVAWTYSDADAQPQTQYELEIATSTTPSASGGAPSTTIVSGAVASSAASATPTPSSAYIEGNYYHVRVRVYDGLEWSLWSGWFACRVRWGLSTHRKLVDVGGVAPTSWAVTGLHTTEPANTDIVLEYNSTPTAVAASNPWLADLTSVPKDHYAHYRAWFFGWGTSPASRPTLDDINIQVGGYIQEPDVWLPTPISGVGATIEVGKYVFGTQSLRIAGNGSERIVRQQLKVEPNTDYVLQGRIESLGNSGASLRLSDTNTGVALANTTPLNVTTPFDLYVLVPWNSGARTTIWVQCRVSGAAGTAGFFDGIKIEKGTVASGWAPTYIGSDPAFIGAASIVDAQGVQVDAKYGGIFRLRGSTGGLRDVIELGANGLKFGGPTGPVEVSSPSAGVLSLGGVLIPTDTKVLRAGTSFPGSPATDDLFYRADRDLLYFWDGTRWLSEQTFEIRPEYYGATVPLSATNTGHSAPNPWAGAGYSLWLETMSAVFYVTAAPLDGSNNWAVQFNWVPGPTVIGTININSGAVGAWRITGPTAIGALLSSAAVAIQVFSTKTGTVGSLYLHPLLRYRLVG